MERSLGGGSWRSSRAGSWRLLLGSRQETGLIEGNQPGLLTKLNHKRVVSQDDLADLAET